MKLSKAPPLKAPVEEHRKHAEEVLARPEHKTPPAGFQDRFDEAKP